VQAYREVVRARPIALPNTSFIMQLMRFEDELKQTKERDEVQHSLTEEESLFC